jgi:5'-methylthioadenosine phosphorylase
VSAPRAELAVIGGSGFYRFLDDAQPVPVSTPYGDPAATPVVGHLDGRAVAFLPRHGADHRFPPHRVPYRANLWALRSLGVRQVLGPCAVGALDPALAPGCVVVPDQVVDRTSGRKSTYYDDGAVHVPFADPYCPVGRRAVVAAGAAAGTDRVVDGGTLVVVPGPRFSSRAESRWHAALGGTLIGMTAQPEAALARELALCYTTVALVTDLDAGLAEGEGVAQAEVFDTFAEALPRLRALVAAALVALPTERTCPCPHALDALPVPFALP